MTIWEYKYLRPKLYSPPDAAQGTYEIKELQVAGKDGWELVGIFGDPLPGHPWGTTVFVLKRPKQPDA